MKLFTRTGQQVVARALLTIPLLMAGQRIWAAPAGLVEDLVRGAAGVGKDVPLRDVEAVLEDLSRSRAGREVIDAELRK